MNISKIINKRPYAIAFLLGAVLMPLNNTQSKKEFATEFYSANDSILNKKDCSAIFKNYFEATQNLKDSVVGKK